MAKTAVEDLTLKHASDAWAIFNVLKTLHAALPDDSIGSEIPTRCLLSHVVGLAESLANALTEATDA
jgi:hypothetical protein